jgi:peptide/nickel transport system substrate-binding protein
MHHRRRVLLALAAVLVLGGCSLPSPNSTASSTVTRPRLPSITSAVTYSPRAARRPGGTITVGSWQFPNRLSPYFGTQMAATPIDQGLFDGLVASEPDLGVFGDLARDVPTIANGGVKQVGSGMDVTFELRQGLTWSDGQPLTPDDVIFTYQTITGPGVAAGVGQEGYDLITSVERAGPSGVVMHFRSLFPAFVNLFPAILPRHRLQGVATNQLAADAYWTKPDVVSGPFTVQDVAGGRITLRRNPHYADGRSAIAVLGHPAYADRVVFQAFTSRQAVLAALKAGDVQADIDLTERELNTLATLSGVSVTLAPALAYEQLSLNQANPNPATGASPPWVGDRIVRQALDLGMDRPGIVRHLGGGLPQTATPVAPLIAWAYNANVAAPIYDLEEARRVLDQDGWAPGSDGVRVKDGHRLAFVLTAAADQQLRATEQDILVAGWRRLGADVTIQDAPVDRLFASFDQGGVLARGTYEAALWSWIVPPDPDSEYDIFHSSATPASGRPTGVNYSRCHDAAVDQALENGRATLDQAQRGAAYRAFQVAYASVRCELPLYRRLNIGAVAPALHNFTLNASPAGNTWNLADWWLDSK